MDQNTQSPLGQEVSPMTPSAVPQKRRTLMFVVAIILVLLAAAWWWSSRNPALAPTVDQYGPDSQSAAPATPTELDRSAAEVDLGDLSGELEAIDAALQEL